jgi:spore coat protein U-like protein
MFYAIDAKRAWKRIAALCLGMTLWSVSALAQLIPSCMATITSPITFSGFDVLSGAAVDTTGTFEVTCSGILSTVSVSVCPSIEAGSGGQSGGIRRMQRVSGTETLTFGLYQDAARTIPWGSVNDPTLGDPPLITFSVPLLSSASESLTIYARLFGGQTGIIPGTYQSDFSGAETEVLYGTAIGLSDCTGDLTLLTESTTAPFIVQTSVDANCLVNVSQNVDFGTQGVLDTNVDTAGELEVTCTSGSAYTVSLARQAGAMPLGSWEMTNGSETVTYGLYTDAARTDLWGDLPSDHVSGTGSGAVQTLDVYGRIPPQTTPSAGSYSDTVVVTVTY